MSNVESRYGTLDSDAVRSDTKNCYRCTNAYVFMISEGIRCDKKRKYIENAGEANDCKFFNNGASSKP
jgi:hypothetical protein